MDVPLRVEVFYDAESFYRLRYARQGLTDDELEDRVKDILYLNTKYGVASVFAGDLGEDGFIVRETPELLPLAYTIIAIHELTHVFQRRLTGHAYPNAPRYTRAAIPGWLHEGMASMMEDAVFYYDSGTSYWDDIDNIPEACDTEIQDTDRRSVYTTGKVAARLLASKVGVRGLFDLYMKSNPSDSVPLAFERTLGFSIDDFNEDFAQHCADGRPQLMIKPIVDYPARHRPLEPWEPACKVVYPEDVTSPESSSIIVALTNICDFVTAFDLDIYDSVAIVDDDPAGLAELIEAQTNRRHDFSDGRLGLRISGVGFATFLTTDLNAAPPSWLIREVGTNFARLMFFTDSPFWLAEGLGETIPRLAEAYATRQPYEHSASSRSSALQSEAGLDAIERGDLVDRDLSVAREAVELLLATYGLRKTATYFAQDEEIEWRVRFESAYGVTPAEFYALYEQHRAAGLPDLPIDLTPFSLAGE